MHVLFSDGTEIKYVRKEHIMAENSKKEISFEEALERLNEIVKALEHSDAPPRWFTQTFRRRCCSGQAVYDQIDQAEAKIKQLVRSSDGTLEEQDFVATDDASATKSSNT